MTIKRDPKTEGFIDSLPKLQSKIYRYMRGKYDEITDYGDHYDVETQDDEVARLASEKFNITEEEAGDLYEKTEIQISKFHSSR
ncbi:hypothetical protein [Alteribacillus iranensis]|uniref:Uncharacterized protein n=1 Tax=Alteribacillus iranensis TaxID=930128 RepID=A0A1I2DK74_9BACI|nr:hypothetical protein [Alteribacillus iranensis]SFE80663.1 hypothetical protein SAMN05192532_104113 [Alteribacillus iranensis]